LIFSAVQTLAAEDARTLSVSDIVRVAEISRSSFYAHFSDVDELAAAFLHATFTEIGTAGGGIRIDGETSAETARRGYRRLIAHIVDHYALYQSTLTLPPMRKAYDDAVAAYARSLVLSIAQQTVTPRGSLPDLVATYAAGGAIAVIRAWLDGSVSMSDDELVEQLVMLLPPWMLPSTPSPSLPTIP
jgi:AcrR family transcriptional regulator